MRPSFGCSSTTPGEHRIFVRTEDRSAVADAEIVKAFFESHGQVLDVYKPGNSPDICYVTLSSQAEVLSALSEGSVYIGQAMCTLQQAVPRGSTAPPPVIGGLGGEQVNNRLFVTGLDPDRVDEEVLRTYFGYFGAVMDVYMPVDRPTGRKKPFAFVTMSTNEELAKILATPQHNLGDGHTVNVTIAMPRDDRQVMGGGFDPNMMAGMQPRQAASNGPGAMMNVNGGMCGFEDPFAMSAEDPSAWAAGAAPQATAGTSLVSPDENPDLAAMQQMQHQDQMAGATPAFGSSPGGCVPHRQPAPGTRLFVFGLPEGLNADMLRGHFWRHGELKDVYMPPRTPDIAYITFSQPAELQAALQYSGLRIAGFWVKGMKPAEDRGSKGASGGEIPARSGGGCAWGATQMLGPQATYKGAPAGGAWQSGGGKAKGKGGGSRYPY